MWKEPPPNPKERIPIMESPNNRREFTRVRMNILSELRSGESVDISGTLANVSMNGMFLNTESHLPEEASCDISLLLDAGEETVTIHIEGTVIRNDPKGMAIQFTKILGPESLTHLQNLVLFNSGEQSGKVEEEFSSHVGIRPLDSVK